MDKPGQNGLLNRRQLLQTAAASAFLVAFPGIGGCSISTKHSFVSSPEGRALALTNANVVDVETGAILPAKVIVILNGIIEAVTDKASIPQEGWLLYDLKHQYVIPGLIDAHCHTTLTSESGLNLFGALTTYRQFKRNYEQQLMHGVTTVRDMGAMPKMLADAIRLMKNDEMTGPRVVYCNAFTNVYRGHPDIDPDDLSVFSGPAMAFMGNPNLWFKDTRELKEKMSKNVAGGASFIKLTMDNQSVMCGLGKIPVYTDEQLRVITEFALDRNLPTAGHVHTKFGFNRALQFRLNSVEHMIGDAQLTDQEALEMAEKKVAIVPTMIIAQMLAAEEAYDKLPRPYCTDFIEGELAIRRLYLQSCTDRDVDPAIHRANMEELKNFHKYGCEHLYSKGRFMARPDLYFNILLNGPGNLAKMKRAGVLIGCGTDSGVPYVYHGTLWREMEILKRIGFTNREVLQCATVDNARILRMADKIGTIEARKCADMVVLKTNPLEKIEACRSPQLVIKGGRIYGATQAL